MTNRCVRCHADLETDRVAVGDCDTCHGEHGGSHAPLARSHVRAWPVHHVDRFDGGVAPTPVEVARATTLDAGPAP